MGARGRAGPVSWTPECYLTLVHKRSRAKDQVMKTAKEDEKL